MGQIVNFGIVGMVEVTADGRIGGWAYDRASREPLTLAVIVDGAELGGVVCNLPRPDLRAVGIDREHVGFNLEIPAPYCDGVPHIVQLRTRDNRPIFYRNGDGSEHGEWAVTVAPEYPIAQLDTWLGHDVHCWAVLVDRLSGARTGPTPPHGFIEAMARLGAGSGGPIDTSRDLAQTTLSMMASPGEQLT